MPGPLLARLATAAGLFAPDIDEAERRIIRVAERHSQTSRDALASLVSATRYLARHRIPGALAECGVWRGGSMMAVALTLLDEGAADRDLWLYDTYAGMPAAGPQDRNYRGEAPAEVAARRGGASWNVAGLELVRANLARTGYPMQRVHLVPGMVEATIPARSPGPLALLRLDTDFYASTAHELRHLYPLLEPGGILIVDDYGHWKGARQAVDEYFAGRRIYLHRVDYTVRLAVKPG